ncbi:MAG: hypothetical protein M1839_005008 [Geoglossum umbratile]|nr:MAG: hypothetical protein M1839_005008 [Geoglossum umbratile]
MASTTPGSPSSSLTQDPHPEVPASQSGFQQTLWSAIILTLIIMACIGASAGIVIASDKQAVTSWKVQPAVLLAVLSSVLNIALTAAMSMSIAITWWRAVLRGTKLANLHHIWEHGTNLNPLPALCGDVNTRKVVLVAGIVAAVKFINNPLLQRASDIITHDIVTNETMMLDVTQRLPDGWPGKIQNSSMQLVIGGPHGLSAAQGWWSNSTIASHNKPGYYCNGVCTGNVPGAGISLDCNSTTITRDLLANSSHNSIIFAINTTLIETSVGVPSLLMTSLYSSSINDSCIATIRIDTCKIDAAVVEYPITIRGTTVTLNYDKLQSMAVDSTYISAGDLSTTPPNAGAGPLEGISDFIGYYLFANVSEKIHAGYLKPTYLGLGQSMMADMFYSADSSSYSNYTYAKCNLKWSSPTKYVINSMHDFMFRSALAAGNGTAQIFITKRTNQALVFHSDYQYLGAALGVIFLALLAVLSLFWRSWELRWNVSLSPLETARAFGAPVLQLAGRNLAVNGILDAVGDMSVRYERETTESRSAMIVRKQA